MAAHRLLPVRRHVRRRCRHALYAGGYRSHAAQVSFGARGRQHPARAHRPAAPSPLGGAAWRRLRPRRGAHAGGGERRRRVPSGDQLLRFDVRRRHHRRRAHRRAGDRRRIDRPRAHAVAARDRPPRPERSVAQGRLPDFARHDPRRRDRRYHADPARGARAA